MNRWLVLSLVGCGGSSDPSCDSSGAMVELPLLADTYVDGSAAAHGGDGSFLIGAANQALVRFQLGPDLQATDLKFTLSLTIPSKADECGGACAPCPAAVAAGGVTVSVVRSDWDETTATADSRTATDPWSMPGPSGADIVRLAATSATASGPTLTVTFNALGISFDPTWPADEITVLISPVSVTSAAIRYSSRSNSCEPASAPRLVATCP